MTGPLPQAQAVGRRQTGNNEPTAQTENAELESQHKPEEFDQEGWVNSLQDAVKNGSSNIVKELLKKRDHRLRHQDPSKEPFGVTELTESLFAAIQHKNDTIAIQLIRAKGIKLSSRERKSGFDRTPLQESVRMENITIVNKLLEHNECVSSINFGDKEARTALHEAAVRGNEVITKVLLTHAAHVNVVDRCNMTPLHLLVWHRTRSEKSSESQEQDSGQEHEGRQKREDQGFLDVLQALIAGGAGVNTKDLTGNTPLHDACENGNYYMASTLLSSGADPGVRNAEGKIPRDLIAAPPQPQIPAGLQQIDELHELAELFNRPWGISERKSIPNIPGEEPACPLLRRQICDDTSVYVRYYWRNHGKSWATSTSITRLVYTKKTLQEILRQFIGVIRTESVSTAEAPIPSEEETWRWIHLPANNMTWVKDLIWRIIHDEDDFYDPYERLQAWSFWEKTINAPYNAGVRNTRTPHAENSEAEDWDDTVTRNYRPTKSPDDDDASNKSLIGNNSNEEALEETTESDLEKTSYNNQRTVPLRTKSRLSLVLPFIDFETEPYLVSKRTRPKHQISKMDILSSCYPPFTGQDGFQAPKTLDASYYNMLSRNRIHERNSDQVVLKWFKDEKEQKRLQRVTSSDDWYDDWHDNIVLQFDDEGTFDDRTTLSSTLDISQYGENFPLNNGNEAISKPPAGSSVKNERGEPSLSPASPSITQATITDSQQREKAIPRAIEDVENIPLKVDRQASTNNAAKLLMVHQLWLWKLDDNTIITCSPDRWHTGPEDTLIDTIRQSGIESMNTPEELIEHIVKECASFPEKFRNAGLGMHVLDIFDRKIAQMSDIEVSLFNEFREHVEQNKRHRSSLSIKEEIGLLYQVKDLRDELNLLRRIFETQVRVLERFAQISWPDLKEQNKHSRERFLEACNTKILVDRVARLDEDAKKSLEELDYLVQVKQAQSSLNEAEAAHNLNNYIVLFTIVTVIFTPLSFLTSLFALPIKQFPHDNSNLSYDSTWITGRMFAGELTTLAVVVGILAYLRPKPHLDPQENPRPKSHWPPPNMIRANSHWDPSNKLKPLRRLRRHYTNDSYV